MRDLGSPNLRHPDGDAQHTGCVWMRACAGRPGGLPDLGRLLHLEHVLVDAQDVVPHPPVVGEDPAVDQGEARRDSLVGHQPHVGVPERLHGPRDAGVGASGRGVVEGNAVRIGLGDQSQEGGGLVVASEEAFLLGMAQEEFLVPELPDPPNDRGQTVGDRLVLVGGAPPRGGAVRRGASGPGDRPRRPGGGVHAEPPRDHRGLPGGGGCGSDLVELLAGLRHRGRGGPVRPDRAPPPGGGRRLPVQGEGHRPGGPGGGDRRTASHARGGRGGGVSGSRRGGRPG